MAKKNYDDTLFFPLCILITNCLFFSVVQSQISGYEDVKCKEELIIQWHDWIYWDENPNITGESCYEQCSLTCTCTLDEANITRDCNDGTVNVTGVRYIQSTRYLKWDNSVLHVIKKNSFLKFGYDLRALHLTNISLQYIQTGAFAGLTGLEYLFVSANQLIELVPGMFEDLSNLTSLFFDNNLISNIDHGTFSGMAYLQWIYARNNMIHDIRPFNALIHIQGIDLAENNLQTIANDTLWRMRSLQILDLRSNLIDDIESGGLNGLVNLKDLYLTNNLLEFINFFNVSTNLEFCMLDKNSILYIRYGLFESLSHLRSLDLSVNKINRIEEGSFKDLVSIEELFLSNNKLRELHSGMFSGISSLKLLTLYNNMIREVGNGTFEGLDQLEKLYLYQNELTEVNDGDFRGLKSLFWLELSKNMIEIVEASSFKSLSNLAVLNLYHNNVSTLWPFTFQNHTNLQVLVLSYNKIGVLTKTIFHGLSKLAFIDLSFNSLYHLPSKLFNNLSSLETLGLEGNPLLWIEMDALNIDTSVTVAVTDFATCCFTSALCISQPPVSPFVSCKRLVPFDFLRVTTWFVCIFAMFGNIAVFYSKLKLMLKKRNTVQSILIANLAVSDILMAVYLALLLAFDMFYQNYFPSHSESWRKSIFCRLAGALSVCSSEASTFFITLITIDRFLGVKYTFSRFRLDSKSSYVIVTILWCFALGISVTVFCLSKYDSVIYAVSEICVGLPISRWPIYTINEIAINPASSFIHKTTQIFDVSDNGSRAGMFFSIALFTGLNLICFFVVGSCYIIMFIHIRKVAKKCGRNPRVNEEIRMAIKMSLIVLTDFCCWVPIAILSILVQTNVVVLDPVVYAWIASFILPINSLINPFLYTLSSLIIDKFEVLNKNKTIRTKTTDSNITQ